ncbi:HepT-like ribonuclease domain-containing protein [Hippea maritima]|uniref:DUF86 domain-containing protein n=1 Tax=Hippea maritima (strain ATCC 700847 / DSM 10411 / MH2) TaxID=760142 RepID=F2LWS1_HIPMA|nr:HepT-like ribonuclease domain-containing protein [Hippea maritima]AEA33049.1 protein of unknown function DUF86 [Hippea maritima DSM 10411]
MFDISSTDRATEFFIFDIYIAVLKIKHTASKFNSTQELFHSYTDWDSVIREFEIIGKANKYLPRDNLFEKDKTKVVDFRNYITHAYFGIDPDRVWNIINNNLDEILDSVIKLIENIDSDLKHELIDSFIEDNKYLDFVVKELEKLKR